MVDTQGGVVNTQDNIKNTQDDTQDIKRDIEKKILIFCITPRSVMEIAYHLGFSQRKSVKKHFEPLVLEGKVAMTLLDKPTSKNQKYVTINQ